MVGMGVPVATQRNVRVVALVLKSRGITCAAGGLGTGGKGEGGRGGEGEEGREGEGGRGGKRQKMSLIAS